MFGHIEQHYPKLSYSTILKKAQGLKFEKEWIQFIDSIVISTLISKRICGFTQINYPKKQLEPIR